MASHKPLTFHPLAKEHNMKRAMRIGFSHTRMINWRVPCGNLKINYRHMKISIITLLSFFLTISYSQNYNQHAYYPESVKRAFFDATMANASFQVSNEKGTVVKKGKISNAKYWKPGGQKVATADFSTIQKEGRYTFSSKEHSFAFEIKKDAYQVLSKDLLKSYYMARVSEPILEKYAGAYARAAGHPDDKVRVHPTAANTARAAESTISSPGGWYDAGDYGKYIVNSGISTYTFFYLYSLYPDYFKQVNTNIPESNNDVPDLLDEAVVNLKWMLTMQDPMDGGVYHKLTSKTFCGTVMPQDDIAPRYVVMQTTAATLDFAATLAKASRVLSDFETYKDLAEECLAAAEKAYAWCEMYPNVLYEQPADVKTGQYDDTDLKDEWFWATSELYISTQNEKYALAIDVEQEYTAPEWRRVATLGLLSFITDTDNYPKTISHKQVKREIFNLADQKMSIYEQSPYHIPTKKFPWGSNSEVANDGALLLQAYHLSNDPTYLEAADACASYLLGANTTGYCFVTGYGHQSPMNIHDRRSAADGVEAPIPGLLAGGPTNKVQSDCGKENYPSTFPAASYADRYCSYSTNEITINWNAAAMALFFGLDAIYN